VRVLDSVDVVHGAVGLEYLLPWGSVVDDFINVLPFETQASILLLLVVGGLVERLDVQVDAVE
jgi:hypothetical protein